MEFLRKCTAASSRRVIRAGRGVRVAVRFAVVVIGLAAFAPAAQIAAAPVFTLLADPPREQSEPFWRDLSLVWRHNQELSPGLLAVERVRRPDARLRLLARGRGHFAVIDTEIAARELARHEGVAAIGLLWPSILHAVAAGGPAELDLPPTSDLVIAPSARYVYEAAAEWSAAGQGDIARHRLLPREELPAGLSEREVLLFSASAPEPTLVAAMREQDQWRLLGFSAGLVEELRLLHPWLFTATLPPGTYPGMTRRLTVPARYLLMVGRLELDEAVVTKMVESLYDRTRVMAGRNPLFGALGESLNAAFAQLVTYHPVAAKVLEFPP